MGLVVKEICYELLSIYGEREGNYLSAPFDSLMNEFQQRRWTLGWCSKYSATIHRTFLSIQTPCTSFQVSCVRVSGQYGGT